MAACDETSRAWQRHVRTAVQLALAEKLHYSAGPVEQHDALEEQGTYDGPWLC